MLYCNQRLIRFIVRILLQVGASLTNQQFNTWQTEFIVNAYEQTLVFVCVCVSRWTHGRISIFIFNLTCFRSLWSHCSPGREAQFFPDKLSCYEKACFLVPSCSQSGSLRRHRRCPLLLWARLQTTKIGSFFFFPCCCSDHLWIQHLVAVTVANSVGFSNSCHSLWSWRSH